MAEPHDYQYARDAGFTTALHDGRPGGNTAPPSRARHACSRCRRQKLKCDNERPCQLCVRTHRPCEDAPQRPRKTRKTEQRASNPPVQRLGESPSSQDEVPRLPAITLPPGSEELLTTIPSSPSWQGRASTLRLVEQVFRSHQADSDQTKASDAIPDSSPHQSLAVSSPKGNRTVSAVFGVELPPRDVILLLVRNYLDTMNWYHCLFHEPTLWALLQPIVDSGIVNEGQEPFLLVLMIVLVTGARYLRPEKVQYRVSVADITRLQNDLIQAIEANLLTAFDECSTDSVVFLFLVASHYLFNRRPSRAFIVFGAAVRAAQTIGLYNEATWGKLDKIDREVRRRLWWTLYVADGFIAQIFGRPAMINEIDIQVEYPVDIDDNSTRCPGFQSTELRDDGLYHSVTIHSYLRLRAALYLIAAPITRDMYSRKKGAETDRIKQAKEIHRLLVDWERKIPPELRLKSFSKRKIDPDIDKTSHIFRLQAFALQISYDNIQLLLHRPLLSIVARPFLPSRRKRRGNRNSEQNADEESDVDVNMARTSKNQCWESAMRTSLLVEYSETWNTACKSPLGAHIGIHTFTAGVMLGIFALSNPLSSQAQESKRGLARIIKMPCLPGYKAPIWAQSTRILEDLLRLILEEEMKALLSAANTLGAGEGNCSSAGDQPNDNDMSHSSTSHVAISDTGQNNTLPMSNELSVLDAMQLELQQGFSPPGPDFYTFMSPEGEINEALLSFQQAFCAVLPTNTFGSTDLNKTPDTQIPTSMSALGNMHNTNDVLNPDSYTNMSYGHDSLAFQSANRTIDLFDGGGQMWMWRP